MTKDFWTNLFFYLYLVMQSILGMYFTVTWNPNNKWFCHFFSFSLNFLNSKCNWSKWEKMVLISVAVCGTKIYYWYSKVNIKFFSLSCKYLYRFTCRSQYDNMRCRKTFPNNVLINKIWFSLNALWFYFEFFVLWKLNWC